MMKENIDALVLGCSHYPYLMPQIKKILGNSVQIIDSGSAVAKQTKRVLNSHKILQTNVKKEIVHQFYSNKNIETLTNLLNRTEVEIMEIDF